jgi:phosphoribosylanthranilate isomerase
MFRTRIKVCGIRDVDSALAAAHAGADAIGLVFVRASPRAVTREQAWRIVHALPAFVEPVGLFVDSSHAEVRATAQEVGLRTVQLHGKEDPAYVEQLGSLRVIKAMSFDAGRVDQVLGLWRQAAGLAGLLVDTPPAEGVDLTGGSGRSFDWNALASLREAGSLAGLPPITLAGGLTPTNVGAAIAMLRPWAVDVSSGVESARGVKDAGLISAFCDAVRAADAGLRDSAPA